MKHRNEAIALGLGLLFTATTSALAIDLRLLGGWLAFCTVACVGLALFIARLTDSPRTQTQLEDLARAEAAAFSELATRIRAIEDRVNFVATSIQATTDRRMQSPFVQPGQARPTRER